MPIKREEQGLPMQEYKNTLPSKTYTMRVGKEVPEGDVNLAYIHVPRVQSDENISLIDTTYTSDNVIPQDQLESIAVANRNGELEYVDLIGNGEVRPRAPKDTFPSQKINITRQFKRTGITTDNALYYKFELDYHYDSKAAIPDDKGVYPVEQYTGQQIELTDENGNALDDSYKHDIYVRAHPTNPRVYTVFIYLHRNTTDIDTIKVRYNHIDKVVPDEQIQSVQNSIEFYSDKDNQIVVDGKSKQMLEGGKLRIVNGSSAFAVKDESVVRAALLEGSDEEMFAIIPKVEGEGYRIIVPQKSEADPRIPRIFSHRVVAEYVGSDLQKVKVTVGHITDWAINKEALLEAEATEYSGDWKNIGMPASGGKLNAKDMIEMALPIGTPSIPTDATYYIEDDNGNLLYHIKTLTDNPNVDTQINTVMSSVPEAKANNLSQKPWKNAMLNNTVVKSNPIQHRCSIIPEVQKTKWDFAWKANGEGYTEKSTSYKTNWQVCANIGFKKSLYPQTLDLLDKSKWAALGNQADVNKWKYSYVDEMGKNVIEYLENADDVMGFYQKKEMIDGKLTDLMSKSDYQFSVKVRLTDPIDDDAIGVLFRVRNDQNYYMFIWEKNQIATTSQKYESDHGEGVAGSNQGAGRIILDEYGYTAKHYEQAATETWNWTSDKSKYLNQWGFGNNHKRIFKAAPSSKSASPTTDKNTWNGRTRYPTDKTGCSFTDITDLNTGYNAAGWEYGKDYKITVMVTGSLFRVYISDNVSSDDLGQMVCQGTDSSYVSGTYGIACVSQRWTYWYDFKMTEIMVDSVCSSKSEVTFTSQAEKKLSNYTAKDLLNQLIEDKAKTSFNGAAYEIFGYLGTSDGDLQVRIDPISGFIYGKTRNASAGGIVRTPWTTDANGISVNGKGTVEYHSDGHFTITNTPSTLPTDRVPDNVKGFHWNEPWLTSGTNVSIYLDQPNIIRITASVPDIKNIGRPYTISEQEILKSDGVKVLQHLFGDDGIFDKLGIPDGTPKEDILLRIERGAVTGISSDGTASTENPEYRVNYRFRCQKGGMTRMPVDQFQSQVGVNRLRLKSIMDDGELDSSIETSLVAWTTFEDLEAVPLFGVKVDEERKIEIEKPKVEQQYAEYENWYLRVKNGRFLKRMVLPYFEVSSSEKLPELYVAYPQLLGMVKTPDDFVEVDLEYTIPEYTNQEFLNKPYIISDKETPIVLNEYAVQTKYAPIVLKSPSGKAMTEIYSIRANQKRPLRISDIDAEKGIIYLHDRIREQDEIYIRYAYQEDWYTYKGFYKENVEPEFFHLDLNPTPGHKHTIANDTFRSWVPTENSKEEFTTMDVDNSELLVKQMYVYLRPSCIRFVDQNNPARNGNPISGTLRNRTVYHTDEEWWFNPKDYKYDPTMLQLGKVMLQANSTMKDNMTVLDTRTRGGGLDESLSKEIIRQINQESMYNWDIGFFDGEAFQENGVIIVRVPRSILKSEQNPNGFHESEVQAAVAKHKGYGILPIIEYIDPVLEEQRFNLLPNCEFLNNQHIGYYDPAHSSGDYEVRYIPLGSNDNYVLQATGQAEYAISVPGHLLEGNRYRLEIKAMREHTAPARSVGLVEVFYKDGTSEKIQLDKIMNEQWMVYKKHIPVRPFIHHLTITLNKTPEERTNRVIYDYVMLFPDPETDEEKTEIIEI